MTRPKKHGVVLEGKNVTFYGDDANAFMALMAVNHVDTQHEAYALIRKLSAGPYRNKVATLLVQKGLKVQKKLYPLLQRAPLL